MNKRKLNFVYGIIFLLAIGAGLVFIFRSRIIPANAPLTSDQVDDNDPDSPSADIPEKTAFSPDNTRIAFVRWNDALAKAEVFIANSDGSDKRLIAQQDIGEGSGELDQDSIEWSADGKYITYSETRSDCTDDYCQSPSDGKNMQVRYKVNVQTGEKKIISQTPLDQN